MSQEGSQVGEGGGSAPDSEKVTPRPDQVERGGSGWSALRELVGGALGVDDGLGRTLVALVERPDEVVESHLKKEGVYVSPYGALFFLAAAWTFVMNLFFDWDLIFRDLVLWMDGFFTMDLPASEVETFSRLGGSLVTTYIVPFLTGITLLHSAVWWRLTRRFRVPFRKHLAVMAYRGCVQALALFPLVVAFGIHTLATFALIVVLTIGDYLGVRLISRVAGGIAVERFFREDSRAIARAYGRAGLVVTGIVVAIGYLAGGLYALSTA